MRRAVFKWYMMPAINNQYRVSMEFPAAPMDYEQAAVRGRILGDLEDERNALDAFAAAKAKAAAAHVKLQKAFDKQMHSDDLKLAIRRSEDDEQLARVAAHIAREEADLKAWRASELAALKAKHAAIDANTARVAALAKIEYEDPELQKAVEAIEAACAAAALIRLT